MRNFGFIVFFIATIITVGSDILVKKGKISDIGKIFKVKMAGTGLLILSVVLMILGKK